ncbi:MAG: class I SAM-dependent methyltransferase [Planctomycetes bacterium]|nr:class I SAM-dependent methyltransferase [Planctomycetota bacterium]
MDTQTANQQAALPVGRIQQAKKAMLDKNEAWLRDNKPDSMYDSYIHKWRGERILELMKPIQGKVLDIGCFDGTIAGKIIKQGDKEVYGMDRMASALELAKTHGVKTIHADIDEQNTDFADGYFDAALATGVLDSLFDPDGVIEELNRVLKPGGTLIVSLPNLACLSNRTLMFFGKPPWQVQAGAREGLGTMRYFTMGTLTDLVERCGFKVTHREANAVVFPFARFGFSRFPILRGLFGAPGTWENKRIFFNRTLAKLFPNLGERLLVVAVKK